MLQPGARHKYLAFTKKHRQEADVIEAQAIGSGTKHPIWIESVTFQEGLRISTRDYTPEILDIVALEYFVKIGVD